MISLSIFVALYLLSGIAFTAVALRRNWIGLPPPPYEENLVFAIVTLLWPPGLIVVLADALSKVSLSFSYARFIRWIARRPL